MQIIDYFDSDRKKHWLDELRRCEWSAGRFLLKLLESDRIREATGEHTRVLLLTDGDELVSFCTYAEKDDIQPTELTPWIGFVYTYPERRGNRCAGLLLDEAERLAATEGVAEIYISTNHVGLYEKYGCIYKCTLSDINGEPSRVYVKPVRQRI
ncbi:MAG: GNAT family N-acetyltransferase [Oscillospiraceae bacterium]|nr:GNAT family N-acetyltransferase [Oscillospiraceae bacterium]